MSSLIEYASRLRISTTVKFLVAAFVLLHFCTVYNWLPTSQYARDFLLPASSHHHPMVPGRNWTVEDRNIVVAKTRDENIEWLLSFCEDYKCQPFVYTMDIEPEEGLLIPQTTNGHEAAAYLTYIIANYEQLPPYTIFIHANEEQWHNEVGPKTMTSLRFLRYEAVDAKGFVNLRCTAIPGCPNTLVPVKWEPVDYEYAYVAEKFSELYSHLLQVPMEQVPPVVGHTCCGQFVVSRDQIRTRPREDYERILNWASTTQFTDSYGIGWTIEKIWHVLFGREPVDCPRLEQCHCDNYGWCGPLADGEILTPIMPDP